MGLGGVIANGCAIAAHLFAAPLAALLIVQASVSKADTVVIPDDNFSA
jgi:hypothetical protein